MASLILSSPEQLDLVMYRGDTGRFRITVTNEDDSPANLTGVIWDADIRVEANSPEIITSFDVVPVVGDTSSVDVILSDEKAELLISGTCYYDVEMRRPDEVVTLVKGQIVITQDVSRP